MVTENEETFPIGKDENIQYFSRAMSQTQVEAARYDTKTNLLETWQLRCFSYY